MKLNWGWSIAIFYTAFVVIMIGMVVMSTQNKVHLVQEKYYDKDLNYEAFRKSRQNGTQLSDHLRIEYDSKEKQLTASFPMDLKVEKGSLTLFRPSSRFDDQQFPLRLNPEGQMIIPLDQNKKGLWKVQLDFTAGGKAYYKEESIVL